MKTLPASRRRCQGLTLVELLVATGTMAIMGGIIFYIFNSGMLLFAKNTAVNVAHQQARMAVLNMEQDLHSAISIPQLVDESQNALPSGSTASAAGIAFQMFAEGPFEVTQTALAGQSHIRVNSTSYKPSKGQRFNLPLHQVELKIIDDPTGVGSNNCDLTLESNLTRPVQTVLTDDGIAQTVIVTGFTSERFCYVVKNGELRYYKPGDAVGKLLANDITSATPFSVPVTPLGATYNRFVAAINLSTADHSSSNRGFKSANMFLNSMVPYRAKLCYYQ